MKKIIMVLAIGGFYCFVIFNLNQRFALNLNQFERWIRSDGNGNIYMVKNGENCCDIIKLDRNDRMSLMDSFYHNNGGQPVKITDLTVDNDNLYILFRYSDPDKWKVIKYSVTDGNRQDIFEMDGNMGIKRLSYRNEKLYFSVAANMGKIEIYELDLCSGSPEMNLILEKVLTEQPKDILYDSEDLYVLSRAGNVWFFQDGKPVRINGEPEGGCTAVEIRDKIFLRYSQREHILYSGQNKAIKTEAFTVISMAGERENVIHILAAGKNGDVLLYTLEDDNLISRTKPLNDSGKRNNAPVVWLLMATLIYISVISIIILLIRGYQKSKRLAVRISMISVEMAAVLIAALGYSAYITIRETMEAERTVFSSLSNQIQMSLLEDVGFGQLTGDKDTGQKNFIYTFYQSDDYRKLDLLLMGAQTPGSARYLLYFDNNSKEIYLLGSSGDDVITGSSAGAVFSGEIISLVCRSIKQNKEISEVLKTKGGMYCVTAAPLNRGTEPCLCLVTAVSMQDMGRKETAVMIRLITAAGCILILTVILLVISVRAALNPVQRLSRAMSLAAEGNIFDPGCKFLKLKVPEHEIGSMWVSFNKMCSALQKKNYLMTDILSAYHRFVPKKIERLMNRESMMDIEPGDMKYISGTLGLISVTGGNQRHDGNPAEYIKFINRCFQVISRNCEEDQGILLTYDCNLSLVNTIFTGAGEKASVFGIDTIRALTDDGCRPVAVIHKSQVLFGAAGTEEQLFPFISSIEIEELSRFIPELRKAGIRMAVTDSVIRKLHRGFSMRYIGYVVSERLNRTFQIYEMLEVYSESEKDARRKTDKKFQEGIQMFYQNDFYLARNRFSSVLKACPEDGIARWYLFTCEAMLNTKDAGDIRHDLFADI